jgi:hypothetical protein
MYNLSRYMPIRSLPVIPFKEREPRNLFKEREIKSFGIQEEKSESRGILVSRDSLVLSLRPCS